MTNVGRNTKDKPEKPLQEKRNVPMMCSREGYRIDPFAPPKWTFQQLPPLVSKPTNPPPPAPRPASVSSQASGSTCPNASSRSLDDSDDTTDNGECSSTKPLQPCDRNLGKEINRGNSIAKPLKNCSLGAGTEIAKCNSDAEPPQTSSRSAGKKICKDSSYRIETEYLQSAATHGSFGFNNAGTVTLTHLPERIKDGIRTLIEKGWEEGIQKEGPCNDKESYYFTLKRRPFSRGNLYVTTRLNRNIIAYLASECWLVQPVPSLLNPFDTLNFRKASKPLPKCYWLAMTYGHAGKWRLKDQLSILGGADELIDTIRLTLQEMNLVSKLKKEHSDKTKNWHQFCIKGSFLRAGGAGIKKKMLLRIMERLEERGWTIYVGYHRTFHPNTDYEHKVGTWMCVKSREWTPTKPVKMYWTD